MGEHASGGHHLPDFRLPHDERVLEGSRACCRVALSIPEAGAVGVASDEGVFRVYNDRGVLYKKVEAHYGRIMGVVSVGEGVVISAGMDGMLRAWALKDTREPVDSVSVPETGRQPTVSCTALFAFGPSRILVGTGGGDLVLYDWDANRRSQPLQALGHVPSAHTKRINSVHGHGSLFVTSSNDYTVAVWTSADFERQKVIEHEGRVFTAAIGDSYIATSQENAVILYRNNREQDFPKAAFVPVPCGVIWTLRFTRPGLVMVCGDGIMNFVDAEKQRLVARVRTGAINIIDADFLPNGDAVLAGNGRESNVIVSLPRELTVPAKSIDVPSQYVIDPRVSDGTRDPRDRDPRRRNSEPNPHNYSHANGMDADGDAGGCDAYRSEIDMRRSYEPRSNAYDYPRRQRPEFRDYDRDSYRGGEGKRKTYIDSRSQYYRYDVSFEYDADRRRNQARRDDAAVDRERERDRDGRENREYRSDSRYYDDRRDDGNYNRYRDDKYYERSNGDRLEKDYESGRGDLPRDESFYDNGNGARQRRSPNGNRAPPGDLRNSLEANRRRRSYSQESAERQSIPESAGQNTKVESEETAGEEEANNKKEANVKHEAEVEKVEVQVKDNSGGDGAVEQNVRPEANSSDRRTVAEEPSAMSADGRSMTGSVHMDGGGGDASVRKLMLWGERGVSKEVVCDLDAEDLAGCMASFMLRYRLTWKNKFEALQRCLLKYFNDNLLTSDDLVGTHAIDANELTESIAEALKKDSNVGAKMGLINGIERFLDTLRKED